MNSDQFDPRYRLQPRGIADKAARRRARFVIDEQRKIQGQTKRRPSEIAWFEDLLDHGPDTRGEPLIGYFCNMVPVELIRALGARPLRLGCGNPALVQPGEEVLAGEICPLVKASFGALMDPECVAARCEAIIVPTSCDAKRKLGEVLSDFKPTFMLNLPPEQDARRYGQSAAREIKRLADFLGQQLGRKLARRNLLPAIDESRRRTQVVRELMKERVERPAALTIRDFHIVVQSSFAGADPEMWLRKAGRVIDEVRAFEPSRRRVRPRIVLTGAPVIWPNFKVLNLIEESGADVVADTLCTGAQSCFDPVVTDETSPRALMRALACRYIFASPCPCFVSQGTRLSRVLELVEESRADGVINYSLRLCQLFDMEVYRLSRVLKEHKIPLLNLRTDYSLEDTEQLRVRLEAFFETVGVQ